MFIFFSFFFLFFLVFVVVFLLFFVFCFLFLVPCGKFISGRDLASVPSSARDSAILRRVTRRFFGRVLEECGFGKSRCDFPKSEVVKLILVFRFCILDPGGKIRTRRDFASVASSVQIYLGADLLDIYHLAANHASAASGLSEADQGLYTLLLGARCICQYFKSHCL